MSICGLLKERARRRAAGRLLKAIRRAKMEMAGDYLQSVLVRQAELAGKRLTGDTDWLGDDGFLDNPEW